MSTSRQRHSEEMARVARYIREHASKALTLEHLAQRSGYSASHLQRVFKAVFGISPKVYQAEIRMRMLKQGLRAGDSVTKAGYLAGYGSPSRLHDAASRSLGMSPKCYREGGVGETISYARGDTPFGSLLIAATDRGVCFSSFCEQEGDPPPELKEEFPKATLVATPKRSATELQRWMQALRRYLEQNAPCPLLPLDLRGSAFQLVVWRFLQTIPSGEARSYGEVARGIGRPRAARAVAKACASNRVALLVPCHRVLRSDGKLGGYRFGGEAKKRALLDFERTKAISENGND